MEKSGADQSKTSSPKNSKESRSSTPSTEFQDGLLPLNWPSSDQTERRGLVHAPVSPSPSRAKAAALKMSVTFGPSLGA